MVEPETDGNPEQKNGQVYSTYANIFYCELSELIKGYGFLCLLQRSSKCNPLYPLSYSVKQATMQGKT